MSVIFNKKLVTNAKQGRHLDEQYSILNSMRNADIDNVGKESIQLAINAGRTPAEAYREIDSTTKIVQVPAGEHATLTRLMQNPKTTTVGRRVFDYRQASRNGAGAAKTTANGQTGVIVDHTQFTYDGIPMVVHDIGFGIPWLDYQGAQADGFDMLVDNSRESERSLMDKINEFLWDGNSEIVIKGASWLGLKNDPRVASATLGVDLTSASATDTRNEIKRVRDILRITNNCTNNLSVAVSREIMSHLEDPFSTADSTFGTILDYVMKLSGISEIYEDSELSGNELAMYWNDQQGFCMVSAMAISTYPIVRNQHNDDYNYVKWAINGFLARTDAEGNKCAIYAS